MLSGIIRSLLVTITVGLLFFWTHTFVTVQNAAEEDVHPIGTPSDATSQPKQPLSGDAKIISEVFKDAKELGLTFDLPGPIAVKTGDPDKRILKRLVKRDKSKPMKPWTPVERIPKSKGDQESKKYSSESQQVNILNDNKQVLQTTADSSK